MPRLHTHQHLEKACAITLSDQQSHYVRNVMRLKTGDELLLFNGQDGEWQATITADKKQGVTLAPGLQTRPQSQESPLHLIFAPIKRGHGDMVAEKATECGVTRLTPLLTQHTIVNRVPLERYRSIATEAAEQCERLTLPTLDEPIKLHDLLDSWNASHPIILCAEQGMADPIAEKLAQLPPGPLALMVGPEGGFSKEELISLRNKKYIVPVHLGPRILRADTAAIAALSIVQAVRGDWKNGREVS